MDREKVINELVEHIESALSVDSDYVDCIRTDLLQYTVALLKEQEAKQHISDAIHETAKQFRRQIVMCKDCKHGEKVPTFKYYPDVTWCNQHSKSHNDDWFCADAERR